MTSTTLAPLPTVRTIVFFLVSHIVWSSGHNVIFISDTKKFTITLSSSSVLLKPMDSRGSPGQLSSVD